MAATQTAPDHPSSVNEHMTRLRIKLMQQKLDNAKQATLSSEGAGVDSQSQPLKSGIDPTAIRYHQSLLKREELLERLKSLHRGGNRNDHDNHIPPQSRKPQTHRDHSDLVHSSEDDEHQEKLTRKKRRNSAKGEQKPQVVQPLVTVQPYPLVQTHPPYPGFTAPLMVPMSSQQTSNKSEYFDMMMVQNAQMHQLFMHQMLMKGFQPGNDLQKVVIEQPSPVTPPHPQILTIPSPTKNKPKTKHYHHYTQLPPIPQAEPAPRRESMERPYLINHIKHYDRRKTPEPIPAEEVEPLHYPKVKPRPKPASRPSIPLEPKVIRRQPFPGSRLLRKLRHIFYAAWFVSFLRIAARKRKEETQNDKFIFGIQLKEAVAALHRTYLNPEGNIFPLLRDAVSPGALDLTKAFTSSPKESQELIHIIENFVYHMTDIMPKTGVLGTHKKAVVYEMMKRGREFPPGYYWEVEEELLVEQDVRKGKATPSRLVSDDQARTLLLGMFISRSFVTTVLMKPLDYGLSSTILDETAEKNLRLIASIMLYIVRGTTVSAGSAMMAMPHEIAQYLYKDSELQQLIERLRKSVDYCDELLKNWTKEFTRRLREADPATR